LTTRTTYEADHSNRAAVAYPYLDSRQHKDRLVGCDGRIDDETIPDGERSRLVGLREVALPLRTVSGLQANRRSALSEIHQGLDRRARRREWRRHEPECARRNARDQV